MPDLLDQLHRYGDALADTVEPVSAATAITTEAPLGVEAGKRRSRWQWRVAASAAAVLAVLIGVAAVLGADGRLPVVSGRELAALEGRTFHAVSVSVDGAPPAAAQGSLSFTGSSIDIVDCTRTRVAFAIDGDRIVLTYAPVANAMDCGDAASTVGLSSVLTAQPRAALDGDHLTLTTASAVVELVEVTPVDQRQLDGRDFVVRAATEGGVDRAVRDGATGALSLSFVDESAVLGRGSIAVFDGCTGGQAATFTVDDGRLRTDLDPDLGASTCDAETAAQARWFLGLVESAPLVALDGDQLRLIGGSTVIDLVDQGSPEPSTPTGVDEVTQGDLAGRTFWGTTISEGGADRLLVGPSDEPPRLSVRFGDDRVVITAGCNTSDSAYRIVDRRLVGGAIRTDVACQAPTADGASALDEQDAWLNAFLAEEPTVVLDGERLRLATATAAIELTDREAWTPAAGLADVSWQLVATRVGADEVTIPDVARSGRPVLLLTADDGPRPDAWGIRFANICGSDGVNVLVTPSELVLPPLQKTTVFCSGPDAELAQQVDAVLQGRATYALEGTTLTITNWSRALVFTRG